MSSMAMSSMAMSSMAMSSMAMSSVDSDTDCGGGMSAMDMSSMGMMSVSDAPPPSPTGDDNVDDQTFSSNNDGEESESQKNGNSDVAGGFAYGILGAMGAAG